ncbi:MAG: hypothetical protein IJ604_08750 [Prevotella sp.]|nr:hypothetical protein [Prevotella sp.]
MNRVIYTERRTFEKYDDKHFIAYLNEEVIPDYVPEVMDGQQQPEPTTGYAYQGPMADGGTLIEATEADRDSLANGIIRSQYSQTEEDAIKTHRLQVLGKEVTDTAKKAEYNQEWTDFNSVRTAAIGYVDRWLS